MNQKLNRTLTLPQLIFYGVGTMVGAGIYSVIGSAAGEAGSGLWISFLFAGIAAFITALSYAELVSMRPKAGAEYQFMKAAFPDLRVASFIAGYLIALNAAATSATVSVAFAGYLNVFMEAPKSITAFLLLLFCTIVNIIGIRQSTWVSIGLICVEVAGLLVVIFFGFTEGDISKSFADTPDDIEFSGVFIATALVFFIFIGFEDVANLAEESKEPKKNIPRALIISVIITSLIYVLVAFSVIALVEPSTMAVSESPLTEVVANPAARNFLTVAALFATASTALISLISISRMLFGMARDGDMPKSLSRTLPKRKTPWIAAISLFCGACLLLPLGDVKIIASVSSFGILLVFMCVQAALIRLRYSMPAEKRNFKVPLAIGRFPVLPLIGFVACACLITQFEQVVYIAGCAALLLGGLIYAANGYWSKL